MKSILLTSTALVAFAGAAAADVSLSGSAEFSYNSNDGYASATEITLSGSQALDNGYTASASLTLKDTTANTAAVDGTVAGGNISISSDAASITYHVGNDGTGAAYLGAAVGKQTADGTLFADDATETETITASATMAGATISASLDAAGDYQLGVASNLGGTDLALGLDGTDFGATLGGSAGDVTYGLGFHSNGNFGVSASTTAGGADLTLSAGNGNAWEIGASMPLGGATVGATVANGGAWTVSAETTVDAATIKASFDNNNNWDASVAYDAGDVSLTFATDEANAWTLDATYDMGNGVTVGAGAADGNKNYAEVDYALGGGAAVGLSYSTDANINPGEDIKAGTTVAVSFSF